MTEIERERAGVDTEKSFNKLIECLFLHVKKLYQVLEIRLGIKIDIISLLMAQLIGHIY